MNKEEKLLVNLSKDIVFQMNTAVRKAKLGVAVFKFTESCTMCALIKKGGLDSRNKDNYKLPVWKQMQDDGILVIDGSKSSRWVQYRIDVDKFGKFVRHYPAFKDFVQIYEAWVKIY